MIEETLPTLKNEETEVFIQSKSSSNIPFNEPIDNGFCFPPLDEEESQGSTNIDGF